MLEFLVFVGLIGSGARAIKVGGRMMGGLMPKEFAGEFDRLRTLAKTDEIAKARLEELAGHADYQRGDKSNTIRIIREQEYQIRSSQYEHGVIVKDGKLIGRFTQKNPGAISIPMDMRPSLNGAVFTHNHPSGTSLSGADWSSGIKYNTREVRAAGSTGITYSIRDTKWDGKSTVRDREKLAATARKAYEKADESALQRLKVNLKRAGYTQQNTSDETLDTLGRWHWHAVNIEVSRSFSGGRYEYSAKLTPDAKKEWDSIKHLFE